MPLAVMPIGFVWIFAVVAVLISGCTALPVGWGGTHSIDYKSQTEIVISYDTITESYQDIHNIATTHCNNMGREYANLNKGYVGKNSMGFIKTYAYVCEDDISLNDPDNISLKGINHESRPDLYNKDKQLIIFTEPAGAKISHAFDKNGVTEENSCISPCTLTFNDSYFQGRPEIDYYVKARWMSGYENFSKINVLKGTNEHFVLNREYGDGYEKDYNFAKSLSSSNSNTIESSKESKLLGVIFIGLVDGLVKGYLQSKGAVYSPNLLQNNNSTQGGNTPITVRTEKENVQHARGCASDYSCGVGYKCIKEPLKSRGICFRSVNSSGGKVFNMPDPESVGINTDMKGQCDFTTDCPIGFKCDRVRKVCIK